MPEIIASTYEILKEIGSGGGGVVYLGRHLRLNKKIVLKADRRELTAKPEHLRREVDALKNLSHTYIPQVYDFVQQDGVVYTIMDYIEGESLDRPLERGERFPQSQIIEWACELLEALEYLHSRPPYGILHGDIKPANVMLTPRGDIRLIDFNIALALGEKGAVRVGYSQGYASPEHYGLNYAGMGETLRTRRAPTARPTKRKTGPGREPPAAGDKIAPRRLEPTEPLGGNGWAMEGTELLGYEDGTELLSPGEEPEPWEASPPGAPALSKASSNAQGVLLDKRSDIYCLGATLYHLLTGQCAPSDAREVRFIRDRDVSPAVAEIIYKAMAPDPDQRWQSAAEMLQAFEGLHENDPRVLRHRRHIKTAAFLLTALFLAGGACAFTGLKQMEAAQETAKLAAESAERAVAAAAGSEDAYRRGDIPAAVRLGAEAMAEEGPYRARGQRALTTALGVYDLTDGFKPDRTLPLSSEPLKLALSPEGKRTAVITSGEVSVFDTETGERLISLPANSSALSDAVFPSENTLLYAGDGALRCYDLMERRELWAGKPAASITLSADRLTAAALGAGAREVVIYSAASGRELRTIPLPRAQRTAYNDRFTDPEDDLFALNGDGTLLAVSYEGGGLQVFDLREGGENLTVFESSEFISFEGGFSGAYLAFSGTDGENAVFAVVDMETRAQTGGFRAEGHYLVQACESGVYIAYQNTLVQLDPVTGEQREVAYTDADITAFSIGTNHTAVLTANGGLSFFDGDARLLDTYEPEGRRDLVQAAGSHAVTAGLDTPSVQVLSLETHPEAQCLAYDPSYKHMEARLSHDGETFMLFSIDGFRLYQKDGSLLTETELSESDRIYDQQYRRTEEESWLEVIYYDGLRRCYSGTTGALISESMGTAPDASLQEEFYTDLYRIVRPLHGAPVVYSRETGERVLELEEDAYLTYVTQIPEGIVTEYMTTQGERYGLLLNAECQVLAELPKLCDITGSGHLLFDDQCGNLRQSRIYSSQELLALGNTYRGGTQA